MRGVVGRVKEVKTDVHDHTYWKGYEDPQHDGHLRVDSVSWAEFFWGDLTDVGGDECHEVAD